MRLQTQWNVGGMGTRTGLNYAGVEIVARLTGLDFNSELFGQVQIMELTALKEMAKHGGREI